MYEERKIPDSAIKAISQFTPKNLISQDVSQGQTIKGENDNSLVDGQEQPSALNM